MEQYIYWNDRLATQDTNYFGGDTLNIVERAYIIHNGEIMKSGTPKEIAQDRNVKQVYLGSKFKF